MVIKKPADKVAALRRLQPQMRPETVEKYIRAYQDEIVVIKYGGGAMTETRLKAALAEDVYLLRRVGAKPVLVHGGGPEISQTMADLNMPVKFIDGYRQTTPAAMDVVKMVLVGKVNKDMVSLINRHNSWAVGLCGDDGLLLKVKPKTDPPGLGRVGEVAEVNTDLVDSLLRLGYIPVIASVGVDEMGLSYNINADSAAAALASALRARHIIFLTNVDGLYRRLGDRTTLLSEVKADYVRRLMRKSEISGGMLPKLEACLTAISGGVGWVHILNGTKPHTIIREIFTRKGAGTMIINK